MRQLTVAALLTSAALLAGCGSSQNFLVYKDAKHFYVTSKGNQLREVLCESGDLARITKDAALPADTQKELFESICAERSEKVKDRVTAALESMTKEQRKALKLAFQINGYQINTIGNC